jgi:hypothetical protein
MKRMTDKLIELGYAERVLVQDTLGTTQVVWTPKGDLLKRELQQIHRSVVAGRGEDGWRDAWTLIAFFIEAQGPPSISGGS